MKKKVFVLLFSALMALSAAGCGSSGNVDSGTKIAETQEIYSDGNGTVSKLKELAMGTNDAEVMWNHYLLYHALKES